MNVDGTTFSKTAERVTETAERVSQSVERDAIRSASRLLLAAASLVFLVLLVSLLPGIDRLVPETPITLVALVSAIATIVLAGLLLSAAPRLASVTRTSLQGPGAVVENVASIVHWLVVLAAVIVAHRGLAGMVVPLLDDLVWAFDAAFLLASLPPVALVAARLAAAVDPAADHVADRVTGGVRVAEGEADGDEAASSEADPDHEDSTEVTDSSE